VQEQFGLLNLFVFGGLNQLIKANPSVRRLFREFLLLILERKEDCLAFEALLAEVDLCVCDQLGISHDEYTALSLRQRHDAYVTELTDKLFEVIDALS